MSNSSNTANLIVTAQIFSTYSTYTTFSLGLIGNILNLLVFTKLKTFHHNRCAFYLIVESMVNIGQLSQTFINEIWKLTLNEIEPMNVSLVLCKVRYILPQWFRLMLTSIVCFVAIDQFLSTNPAPYLRQLSSLKIARYQIYVAICLCFLDIIPFAVFSQIHPSLGCILSNGVLINYYSYFYFPILTGLLPIFVSSLFSMLAYRNVRHIVRRQIPLNRRRLDQQLTAMIFVRIIFFVSLQLPYTIYRIYSLRLTIVPDNTIEWIRTIALTLMYFNHGVNFLF